MTEKDIRRIFQPGNVFGSKAFQKLIDFIISNPNNESTFKDYTEAGGTKTEEDFKTSLVKSIDNPVLTSEQTLNDDQKAQARTNIGAVSEEIIGDINSILDTINGKVI